MAVGALAGCAMQSSSQTSAASIPTRTTNAHVAPLAYGQAAPPDDDTSTKLGDAKPIDSNVPDVSGFRQTGRASWYGKRFNGRRTANGERFDMHALTAAHKTLPLASFVRVTNAENNKSVVVRINDRGPYVRGRVIDLSYAAARELGLEHVGTGRVEIVGLTQEEAAEAQREVDVASNGTFKEARQ